MNELIERLRAAKHAMYNGREPDWAAGSKAIDEAIAALASPTPGGVVKPPITDEMVKAAERSLRDNGAPLPFRKDLRSALEAASSPAPGEAWEKAWLIEYRKDDGQPPAGMTMYYAGRHPEPLGGQWSHDHNDALRFARHQDAWRFMLDVLGPSKRHAIVEHAWGQPPIYASPPTSPPEPPQGVLEALKAGWNACRKSIYAVCEDMQEKPFSEALRGITTPTQEAHNKGFNVGWKYAAKSIARCFNSMEAMDDDNLRAAIANAERSLLPLGRWRTDMENAPKSGTFAMFWNGKCFSHWMPASSAMESGQ